MKPFDPRVLVFACNWCSYAGADTAGVSRLPQTPHFRLLRVMCSGRVHPAFVLRAFAQGADGVMVSGCHYGDCHYRFGNYRAAEQFTRTQALVELLGLGTERLRLEWVSAAEGARFAELMNEFVAAVRSVGPSPVTPGDPPRARGTDESETLTGTRLWACLECGRCTGVCPVARYQRFSPRRLISQALSSGPAALVAEPSLWTCLTCQRCQAVCPTGVDYDGFILAARAAVMAAGESSRRSPLEDAERALLADGERVDTPGAGAAAAPVADGPVVPCSHGGVFEQISLMMARPGLRQKRLGWVSDDLAVRVISAGRTEKTRLRKNAAAHARHKPTVDLLYTGCSPYFAAYFGGPTAEGLEETMRSAVRLLNRVGITPHLLENERCCGYHLRLAGRRAEADALEERVLDQIARSGAQRVITFCPECLVGLRQAAGRRGIGLDVVHLSTLLWGQRQALGDGRGAGAQGAVDTTRRERVTYQDPCRLGRYARIYDAPRDLLVQIGDAEIGEMAHHRQQAICCGNSAWLNCNAGTKQLQTARLDEAVATGSARLLTACPGCYIHLRCAQEGLSEQPGGQIAIEDLWCYLERTLAARDASGAASAEDQTPAAGSTRRQAERRESKA